MSESVPDTIHYACHHEADQRYLKRVTAEVLQSYDTRGAQWQVRPGPTLWPISLGGRAGVVGVRVQDRVCCAKLFYDRRWTTLLRTCLGRAKGKGAYHRALRLRQTGVSCPAPIGYAELRPWGPVLLVTELIADGHRLDHWIEANGTHRAGIDALARFLRAMHDHGITHQDLSPRNILVRSAGATCELYILDYEDTRFAARVSEKARLDDLHHLNERCLMAVGLRDRLRCLRGYAGPSYRRYREMLNQRMTASKSKYVEAFRQSRAFGPEDRRIGG